jgi:hypothetical protein
MFTTYEDQVLSVTDDNGSLDLNDACHLLNQHDALLTDYIKDTGDRSLNAESMLAWLGY